MKKKVLLSSALTIAICLCLIAGSTFALFTSTSTVNIAVTAGEVDMVAGIAITKLESVKGDTSGSIYDEKGNSYSYETVSPKFTNGGTAEVVGSVLTLKMITPGDKVTFEISGANESDVAIQYRYIIDCVGEEDLMKGLRFTVNGVAIDKYMETYTSAWAPLASGTDMPVVPITVELPVTADNKFETLSTEIRVLVEAVQGNAVVDANTAPVITYYNTAASAEELKDVLADNFISEVEITEDLVQTIDFPLYNKVIDAKNHDVALTFTSTLSNVVVKNIVETTGGTSINVKGASGSITLKDSTFVSADGTKGVAIATGPNASVTVIDSSFSADPAVKNYAVYNSGASGALTFNGCTFANFTKSWVIQINNAINGDVVINQCTFNAEKGIFKALSGVNGDFTFTNNTMIGCKGDDGDGEAMLVSTSKNTPVACTGTKTVTGNTLDGADWVQ